MIDVSTKLLKNHKLKVTSQRLSILSVLLSGATRAFSSSELIKSLGEEMNRSTIYRSMDALLQRGLVLKMVDKNGETIYSLNIEKRCNHMQHPHLKCDECGALECLPEFPNDYVSLLEKSGVDDMNVVLGGVCSKCTDLEEEA